MQVNKRKGGAMALLFLFMVCPYAAAEVEPVAEFLFEQNVTNLGTAGEIAEIFAVSGMQPAYASDGVGGYCLNNTSASGMGASGGMVRITNSALLSEKLTDLRSFTVMGWMKSDSPLLGLAGIVCYPSTKGFRLRAGSTNRLVLEIAGQNIYSDSAANYACPDWKFFAVTYDGTRSTDNLVFYYANNDAADTVTVDSVHSTAVGTLFADPAYFYIANVATAGHAAFDGRLDTIRVFASKFDDTAALTPEQVGQWKNRNGMDPARLCVLDTRFEGNIVSEGRDLDLGFINNYGVVFPEFSPGGVDGGLCLDHTGATGMGNRGPYTSFSDPYGISGQLSGLLSFTVMGWMKAPSPTGGNARVVSCYSPDGMGFEVITPSENRLAVIIDGNTYTSSAAGNFSCSDWKFFVVRYDGTKTTSNVRFYFGNNDGTQNVTIDGVASSSVGRLSSSVGSITLGNRGTIYPFDGYLDSIKIFASRDDASAALSTTQMGLFKNDHQTRIDFDPPAEELKKSDVAIMRTSSGVPAMAYAANRIVWNYDTHRGVVDAFRALGIAASQTHNFEATAYYGNSDYTNGKYYTNDPTMPSRSRDIAGNLLEKNGSPGFFYPSVASPAFQEDTLGRLVDFLLPLEPYTVQYDTPMGDRHATYLGYNVGFDDWTLQAFKYYLDDTYTDAQLLSLFNIPDIGAFNYKTWLQTEYGINTDAAYRSQYKSISLTPDFEYMMEDNIVDFITQLKNACHAADPPAKISGNLAGFRFYNRVLFPVLDFINMEMPDPYSAGTLDEQDAVCAKLAEAYGLDIYGVNHCKTSEYLYNNDKPNYMKCLIAAMYANGQVLQVPWNIWACDDLRYYDSADEHGALTHFIRNHPQSFDNYTSHSQVALLWNCDELIDELNAHALILYNAGIPFDILPLGDRYPYSRIDINAAADKYAQIALAGDYNSWSAENRATIDQLSLLTDVVSGAPSVNPPDDWVSISGAAPGPIWILPRVHETDPLADVVVHILNRAYSKTTDSINTLGCTIDLHRQVYRGLSIRSVTWMGPESPDTDLTWTQTPNGISLTLPETPMWSLLKIDVYLPGDLNENGFVDFVDFSEFALQWMLCSDLGQPGCTAGPLSADLDNSSYVNEDDLNMLIGNWLQ